MEKELVNDVTITSRTRSLGYGATAVTEQRYNATTGYNWISVMQPDEDVRGGLRTVEEERWRCLGLYGSGTCWCEALFLGGRRVDLTEQRVVQILMELRERGSVAVSLVPED